jgi:redox-sensitive bicupin YhaK (pirin superfamily)
MASNGPFVMNDQTQLKEAEALYRDGGMGRLAPLRRT